MGSDQIAEIAPGVREMLAGGPDWCATFEIPSDSDRWVQFTVGIINAAYPHNEAPESRLGELGSFTLEEWEPNKYVSGKLALEDARSIACPPTIPAAPAADEMIRITSSLDVTT